MTASPFSSVESMPFLGLSSSLSVNTGISSPARITRGSCYNPDCLTKRQNQTKEGRVRRLSEGPTNPAAAVGVLKKRRAAVACQRCRARKVRCISTENQLCINCKWDKTECIWRRNQLGESSYSSNTTTDHGFITSSLLDETIPIAAPKALDSSPPNNVFLDEVTPSALLPPFLKQPLSIEEDDISYLRLKGAWDLPPISLQNSLLRAYVNFVHPYLPLLELSNFIAILNAQDGRLGQTSLLLYHAVMFAASAFVDIEALRSAGYLTRKTARQALFRKTQLLYTFDYEPDRLIVVQSLLLMSYWQETPEDNKDMWHWLGIAISLAETIGLQRNPAALGLSPRQQKLRKRIWWCCAMRDCLIALGLRQSSRIKSAEFDVPMLQESDFEVEVLPDDNAIIPADVMFFQDIAMQKELVALCISKAQLCVCINKVLKAQYILLTRDKVIGQSTTWGITKLCPRPSPESFEIVTTVDEQLLAWADSLPSLIQDRPLTSLDLMHGKEVVAVHRTLLHMLYYTAMSALHRPHLLPLRVQASTIPRQMQELSQLRVRTATMHVTRMTIELYQLRLERYLPVTGVSMILLAMVIMLLGMKGSVEVVREQSNHSFIECMRVLEKLRETYDTAEWATSFLEAAVNKAAIRDISLSVPSRRSTIQLNTRLADSLPSPVLDLKAITNKDTAIAVTSTSESPCAFAIGRGTKPSPLNTENIESARTCLTSVTGGEHTDSSLLSLEFLHGQGEADWNIVTKGEADATEWLHLAQDLGFIAESNWDY